MVSEQLRRRVDVLTDAERAELIQWLLQDYCSECGAAAWCTCEDCICECRKRFGAELRELWRTGVVKGW